MKLTEAHIRFWRAKKAPTPAWFKGVKAFERIAAPSIDGLVNAHAGIRLKDNELAAHNALAILRSMRKHAGNQGVRDWLFSMSVNPGTIIDPKRRAGYCRKWLKRIERA